MEEQTFEDPERNDTDISTSVTLARLDCSRIRARKAEISDSLDFRSLAANKRAERAGRIIRELEKESRQLNKKIEWTLAKLTIRYVFYKANDDGVKQDVIDLIVNYLRRPRHDAASLAAFTTFLNRPEVRNLTEGHAGRLPNSARILPIKE